MEVTILREDHLLIEFHSYGHDEGGPRYSATYESLDELIEDVERIVGAGLHMWENYSASGNYPPEPAGWTGAPSAQEQEAFRAWVAAGKLKPPSDRFRQCSSYWAIVEEEKGDTAYDPADHHEA